MDWKEACHSITFWKELAMADVVLFLLSALTSNNACRV